ncbi:hypothetical protein GIB67_008296 [Kingdonia uniflora]|uniref:Uncharacterized protein n=1 Tax=Kingdonia uniflora TaxID=39325 RepID=A0A7J7N4W9_9MAGN|nr:hypothetical protein GIB67_008296 [Kingdonia uniflora]
MQVKSLQSEVERVGGKPFGKVDLKIHTPFKDIGGPDEVKAMLVFLSEAEVADMGGGKKAEVQGSKVKWLTMGGNNTKYFYSIENAMRHINILSNLQTRNEWDPWDVPDGYECEVIENDAPVPSHVPLHRPGPLPAEFYKTLEAVSSKPKEVEPAVSSTNESQIKE